MSFSQQTKPAKEKSYPLCTIKYFPYLIEHTISWAGPDGQFGSLFEVAARDLLKSVTIGKFVMPESDQTKDPLVLGERLSNILRLLLCLENQRPNYARCVAVSFDILLDFYKKRIQELIFHHPKDSKDPIQPTLPFWLPPKRFPRPLELPLDEMGLRYLHSCANIYSLILSGPPVATFTEFKEKWRQGDFEVSIANHSSVQLSGHSGETDEEWLVRLSSTISLLIKENNSLSISVPQFNKDDDKNYQIDFITAASNLRARIFSIPEVERHRVKVIVGKIVPAIVSTTAAITGLNSVQICLSLDSSRPLTNFSNYVLDLATSDQSYFYHLVPVKREVSRFDEESQIYLRPVPETGFTIWDHISLQVKPNITLGDFMMSFPSLYHGVKLESLFFFGSTVSVYSTFQPSQELQDCYTSNLSRTVSELWRAHSEGISPDNWCLFSADALLDGEPVSIPQPIILKFTEPEP